MVYFAIDTRKNSIAVSNHPDHKPDVIHSFKHRWEAHVLGLLVTSANTATAVQASALNAVLAKCGQCKPLNRAQVLRLLSSLADFFHRYPDAGLEIKSPPRKATVGPWLLEHNLGVVFLIDGTFADAPSRSPCLTADLSDTDSLHHLLSALMVADAFAMEGAFALATEVLESLDLHPLLSDEACGLIRLRLCTWYKRMGRFTQARAHAQAVIDRPLPADPALQQYAQFMLARIDYDENPASTWEQLWVTTQNPPESGITVHPTDGSDWRTLSEWHNLRALLGRRHLHAHLDKATPAWHAMVLQHHQAALYKAIWCKDWDVLQAYVINVAYYLQSLMGVKQPFATQANTVMQWHRLIIAYENKFNAGRDSAWDYIFFGKFWLDHRHSLSPAERTDPLAHALGDSSPEHETFYQQALQRMRQCGDARQIAIGHTLYLRYANDHMSGRPQALALQTQAEQLLQLLVSQPDKRLLKTLRDEGYSVFWPEELLQRLKVSGKK